MKKFIIFTSILFLSLGIKADIIERDGIYYQYNGNYSSGEATVLPPQYWAGQLYNWGYQGDVVIQNEISIQTASDHNFQVFRYDVTTIQSSAFYGCAGLTSIVIPNSVTTIGSHCFYGCSGLTSIVIPNSVTSIGELPFACCSGLISIIVEENNHIYDSRNNCNALIESSSNSLIAGCSNTIIPNSVTSIGDNAFYGCTGLTNIEIPNSVTTIGDNAFYGCSGLTRIKIPQSVTTIGKGAFEGCNNLTTIEIGGTVMTIGDYAFQNCTGLTNLIIPGSVTSIGEGAFDGCDNIDVVYSLVTKVFTIDEHAFSDIVFNNADLYIPKGKLASYQGTNYWSKFLNIHEGAPTEVGDLDRSYKLKVSDAGMASMYLDYPVAIPDNDNMLGVFYVCSMNDHILNLRRLKETIPANCGVIVMANQGTFTFKETLMSTDVVEENLLSGTTVKVKTADIPGDVYTLGRGVNSGYMGFHKYTGTTLPANKAYLVRNADEEEDDVLVIDRSAFDELFDSTTGVTKVVIDGEGQSVIYDLQGRRVEHPSKGIYIVNGKKKYIK